MAGDRMKKNFTAKQMLHMVRQAESGTPVAEVCRKMGIAELTRLRQLEEENKKLKTLVADLTLDKHMAVRGAQRKF